MPDKIKVLLCDYRLYQKEGGGRYDKFVSIGMLEAVGKEYLNTYFEVWIRCSSKMVGIAVF